MVGGGPFRLEPGEWTDDTSMALYLADSLIARDELDQRHLMERFVRCRRDGQNSHNGRCFDIGITTRQASVIFGSLVRVEGCDQNPTGTGDDHRRG
jgi:ADP-ribosyl-[dinitrogen reductase] hydrolase